MKEETLGARLGLAGIRYGPPEDWSLWQPLLGEEASLELGQQAEPTAVAIIDRYDELASSDVPKARTLLARSVDYLGAGAASGLTDRLLEKVSSRRWWSSDDEREKQEALHEVLWHVLERDTAARDKVLGSLERDVLRPLDDLEHDGEEGVYLRGVTNMAEGLPAKTLETLARRLARLSEASVESDDAIELESELTLSRIAVARARGLTAAQAAQEPYGLSTNVVGRPTLLRTAKGREYLALWMASGPTVPAVEQVIRPLLSTRRRAVRAGLEAWAEVVGEAKRTTLAVDMTEWPVDVGDLIRVLSRVGVDEKAILAKVLAELSEATSGKRRAQLARSAKATRAQTDVGVVATFDIARWLLGTNKHVDFDLAQTLTEYLPTRHVESVGFARELQETARRGDWSLRRYASRFIESAKSRSDQEASEAV